MTDDVSCRELVELMSEYLDKALPNDALEAVSAHLTDCPGCQSALSHLQQTIAVTRTAEVAALTPEVRRRLIDEFRRING